MHDSSSMPNIISPNIDRSSLKTKGNLFKYLKMPYNNDYSKIKDQGESGLGYTDPLQWTRQEKYIWFFTLLAGTTACYSARTTMPLVAPSISADMKWSKTEMGTVLSSFFWGYSLTQVLGGYLSDRFGAERVLLASGLGWGLITFWFHQIVRAVSDHDRALHLIVFARVLLGAFQGTFFPAVASISSRNLAARDRSFFFSSTTAGASAGTLLTGTLGSYLNESYGWPSVFYIIGFVALLWTAILRYYAIETARQRKNVIAVSSGAPLLVGNASNLMTNPNGVSSMPWLTYLRSPALWACAICHFCQNNCFFILLSWLPTYFHDNFPEEDSKVFNVVPWLSTIPGIICGGFLTKKLLADGVTVAKTRKIVEGICMITEAICLLLIGQCKSYIPALILLVMCLFGNGFHNMGCVVNPQDLAPQNPGSIFGIMNACGSLPGFLGVYLAGYILDITGSWMAVFNATAVINLFGITIFFVFGSATPIV